MPIRHLAENRFVFADFHLGEGKKNNMELFIDDDIFVSAEDKIMENHAGENNVLVLLGDFFDFLAVEYRKRILAEPTEVSAHEKLQKIIAAHPKVMAALQKFLAQGKIKFFTGNHDLDLRWPSVQLAIKQKLAEKFRGLTDTGYSQAMERVEFIEEETKNGVLFIHGNNGEAIHALPDEKFITSHLGRPLPEPLLNIPYGNHIAADLGKKLAHGSLLCKGNRWVGRLEPHWYIYAESFWKNWQSRWFGLCAFTMLLLTPLRHFFSRRWWVRKSASFWTLFRANFEAMILTAINLLRGRDYTHYPLQILKDNQHIDIIFIGHIHEFRHMVDKHGTIIFPGNWCTTYDVQFPTPTLTWKRWRSAERVIKFFWAMRKMFSPETRHLYKPKKRELYSFGVCKFFDDGYKEVELMRYNPKKDCLEKIN